MYAFYPPKHETVNSGGIQKPCYKGKTKLSKYENVVVISCKNCENLAIIYLFLEILAEKVIRVVIYITFVNAHCKYY